ncbi:Anaphase-promoting complex subunit cut9 [Cyphellophora attinorum]|uniref:Anaphase-promoting complex subunit cut9 n=1 Tax=Cyphellophora attinorum TaxID=1664694 RepID=A0A0N1H5R8_9EURO|nr:Anaphase-promoting complex subunit cut9 [Phialophora attinorum]KPI37824.1 Anaphase-promoting complex subunit cut9 [Phialophora attinorum]
MEKFLRSWRQDAVNRGQHDTAVYIGDKILALSNLDSDAFWLAQVHFSTRNYTRALSLLSRKDLIERSLSCRYLAANCFIKQGRYEHALNLLGEDDPVQFIQTTTNARRKLAHVNGTARHGPKTGRGQKDRIDVSEERDRDREQAKELRFEAGMCYLRGLCYARRDAFDRARDCYKNAVRIDVQCFEAFEELMKNSMMSPAEELAFLEELDFDSVRVEDQSSLTEAADFTKMLYTTRLSKYTSPGILAHATETLSTHYNLASNPDMLLARAEMLYTQCRFHQALAITTEILNTKPEPASILDTSDSNTAAALGHSKQLYPLHLALLYETGSHNTLFHLSHTLSVHAPHESYTYLAIGTYYFATARIAEARRFFSKASLMDPHSAAAWIGFAHTFAAEGEHDQAIAAYSTGSRLFQGSHLPQVFMGMQHLALNNMQLAWQYCSRAFEMSTGVAKSSSDLESFDLNNSLFNTKDIGCDPLVLNEIGVILYHQSNLPNAARLFKRALELASSLGCNMTAWVATRANLAHTLRRLNRLEEALAEFDECLRTATGGASPSTNVFESSTHPNAASFAGLSIADAATSNTSGQASGYDERNLIGSIHTSRGIVLLSMLGRTKDAVMALHEAVRVLGGDAGGGGIAGTLLGRAIEIWALEEDGEQDSEDENDAEYNASAANVNVRSRKAVGGGGKSRNNPGAVPDEGGYDPTHGGILVLGKGKRKGRQMDYERTVASELDGDADEILEAAYSSLR